MPESVKSPISKFRGVRWLLPAALLDLLLACGGGGGPVNQVNNGVDQANQVSSQGGQVIDQTGQACVSQPSVLQTANCPFPKTGTYGFRNETASCKAETLGKPIALDQSACVTPNLSVTMEFAQTHVIPAKGLRWYKKVVLDTDGNRTAANDWIKVSEGVRWSPVPNHPAEDWTKANIALGSEVPTGYILDATLRITSNRSALVLVDTGSNTVQPKNPKLQIWKDGLLQASLTLNPPAQLDPTESNGIKYAKNCYSLMLDAKYVWPGLRLRVVSDDYGVSNEVVPELGADAEMAMWVLPFYLFGASEANTMELKKIALPDATTIAELASVWPFTKLDFQSHRIGKIEWPYLVIAPQNQHKAYKMTTVASDSGFDHYSSMLNIIKRLRDADGSGVLNHQYYAPFFTVNDLGKNSTQTGNGIGGGNAGVGDYLYGNAFYHEQGHAFNLAHAGDAYSNSYPYYFGSVKESAWGYDMGRRKFLNRIIPPDAPEFSTCNTDKKHLLTSDGRCWKQDPMQSGQGDQAGGSLYTMMADYYVARIQQWLEGVTTSGIAGVHTYSDGKIMPDSSFNSGYSRWDGVDKKRVTYTPSTEISGLFSINQGLPAAQGVPVQTIVLTHSIAGTLINNSAYPYPISTDISQIYPLIETHIGNLNTYIDPSDRANIGDFQLMGSPDGKYSNVCNNYGCDFTLRVTFSDNTVQHILLQGLVHSRSWYGPKDPFQTFTDTDGSSFGTAVVNVSAKDGRKAKKAELLFTPTPWLNWPVSPQVIASRAF